MSLFPTLSKPKFQFPANWNDKNPYSGILQITRHLNNKKSSVAPRSPLMATRASFAGIEVPVIGIDSVKWFNVSVTSTSTPPNLVAPTANARTNPVLIQQRPLCSLL
ncbi:hypothetical protein M8C21_006309 [Ambrosia artemisiifolia]|uniref:Uncharacterized protein n=1 Tax=Ambrosia artemisiifolia TaxID=4212 RepID=A0AAD5GL49_AMBAR|nr:hypothetical protein M8C21_006309 [Ambrosia artemisiifolia]